MENKCYEMLSQIEYNLIKKYESIYKIELRLTSTKGVRLKMITYLNDEPDCLVLLYDNGRVMVYPQHEMVEFREYKTLGIFFHARTSRLKAGGFL